MDCIYFLFLQKYVRLLFSLCIDGTWLLIQIWLLDKIEGKKLQAKALVLLTELRRLNLRFIALYLTFVSFAGGGDISRRGHGCRNGEGEFFQSFDPQREQTEDKTVQHQHRPQNTGEQSTSSSAKCSLSPRSFI